MKIYQNPDPDPAGFRQAGFRIPDIQFSVKIRPDPDIRYSPSNMIEKKIKIKIVNFLYFKSLFDFNDMKL